MNLYRLTEQNLSKEPKAKGLETIVLVWPGLFIGLFGDFETEFHVVLANLKFTV